MIIISLLSKHGIEDIGSCSSDTMLALVNMAKIKNLHCLSFINLYGNTYFNKLQMALIKQEIEILHAKEIDPALLAIFEEGINKGLKINAYILVEGD